MTKFISPLTWTGGKAKQWKEIYSHFPKNQVVFVDLFMGGGSILLNALNNNVAKKFYGNDIDAPLINFWLWVLNLKDEELNLTIPSNLEEAKQIYAWLDTGAKFFFDNVLTFSGFRKGTWTKERLEQNFVKSKLERIKHCNLLFNSNEVKIKNLDYGILICQIMEKHKQEIENVFFFLDPPYFYNKGNVYEHGNLNFDKFKIMLDLIDKMGAKFLVTLDDSKEVRDIFQDRKNYKISSRAWKYTSSNTNKSNCKLGKELFITNYEQN